MKASITNEEAINLALSTLFGREYFSNQLAIIIEKQLDKEQVEKVVGVDDFLDLEMDGKVYRFGTEEGTKDFFDAITAKLMLPGTEASPSE